MAVIISQERGDYSSSYPINKKFLYSICFVVALGGVLFGFDLVIISGTVPFFVKLFKLDDFDTGWAVGCINIGAAAGVLVAGKLADAIGRRKLLIICALLFALTGLATGWAGSFSLFIIARLLSGVAVGSAALVCPMYIAEISPPALRGRLVSLYQLAIVSGLSLAYLSNYLLLDTGINNWRWMFSSQTVPSLLFFAGLFFVPESPRWLIKRKQMQRAHGLLSQIAGIDYADKETDAIQKSFLNESGDTLKSLFKPDLRGIMFIGIVVAVASQAVGQNSLFSYAPVIFKQAGMGDSSAFQQSIMVGAINFLFTFVAIFSIDKIGRKTLLTIGSILLAADAVALALCFYYHAPGMWVLVFVLGFIGIYGATLGPVTWVLLSEIFPNRVRGNAMSMATLSLWIANFFTTASFPILKEHFGMHITFAIHALICLCYFFFIRYKIPETKGRSLEQIEKQLVTGHEG